MLISRFASGASRLYSEPGLLCANTSRLVLSSPLGGDWYLPITTKRVVLLGSSSMSAYITGML